MLGKRNNDRATKRAGDGEDKRNPVSCAFTDPSSGRSEPALVSWSWANSVAACEHVYDHRMASAGKNLAVEQGLWRVCVTAVQHGRWGGAVRG